MNFEELQQNVIQWADERGILKTATAQSQFLKTVSEVGELADALAKGTPEQVKDGIGDTIVTLILVAKLAGMDAAECLEHAYREISNRKGKMVNGVFVKEA